MSKRILDQRERNHDHQRRNLYLLQGLIFVETEDGVIHRMRWHPQQAARRWGNPNYHIKGLTVPCGVVDAQIPGEVQGLRVDETLLPKIRQAYLDKFKQLGKKPIDERASLDRKLKKLVEDEANAAIKAVEMGLSTEACKLMQGKFKERREQLETARRTFDKDSSRYVADLDVALHLFAEIAVLFEQASVERQQALLKHVVKRVVIDPKENPENGLASAVPFP